MVPTKILSSTTAFNIDINKKCFLSRYNRYNVTLKTGVMAAENSALLHMKKKNFQIY